MNAAPPAGPSGSRPAGLPGPRPAGLPAPPPVRRHAPGERARLTSRAAVLAVVVCAIALSLAYPVREYIGQRRQIDQLAAARQVLGAQLRRLRAEQSHLTSPAYVRQQAQDRLHMCMPGDTCYIVVNAAPSRGRGRSSTPQSTAWYERLWASVQQAGGGAQRQPDRGAAHRHGRGASR